MTLQLGREGINRIYFIFPVNGIKWLEWSVEQVKACPSEAPFKDGGYWLRKEQILSRNEMAEWSFCEARAGPSARPAMKRKSRRPVSMIESACGALFESGVIPCPPVQCRKKYID